jgi:endoglucanase
MGDASRPPAQSRSRRWFRAGGALLVAGALVAAAAVLISQVPPADGAGGVDRPAAAGAARSRPPASFLLAAGPYVNPDSAAAVGARLARADGRGRDAALLAKAAGQGSARWLSTADSVATVQARVRTFAAAAKAAGQTAVFVAYAIPDRDCGNHSAGGFTLPVYRDWSAAVARGLAGTGSVMIVEPDSLLQVYRCGNAAERFDLLREVSAAYAAAGAEVYLDAGSSNTFGRNPKTLADIAARLTRAGVRQVAGFATNVSNFQTTADERAYGRTLSRLLGGARFVIDTSRNGNGAVQKANRSVWCNPPGRALGDRPGATVDGAHVANLWVKTVGLSDGTCNGGPRAGTYWEPYLLGLAANARW